MSDKQIKWLILIIPTLIIGFWEYIRHEFLLPYISMELGNWLSPVIVFLATVILLVPLFQRYEQLQEQLKKEREEKAILQERERLAHELHDGIAQSLFLITVQVQQLKKQQKWKQQDWETLDKHLRQIHDDVRHSIANLKSNPAPTLYQTFKTRATELAEQFYTDTGIEVTMDLSIHESALTPKEKVELLACLQEALSNIRKHARATKVDLQFLHTPTGWTFQIIDNGKGYQGDPFQLPNRYGLKIMRDRVSSINSKLTLKREQGKTIVMITKGEP